MNLPTIIILALVIGAAVLAFRQVRRRGTCSCSECSCGCANCPKQR